MGNDKRSITGLIHSLLPEKAAKRISGAARSEKLRTVMNNVLDLLLGKYLIAFAAISAAAGSVMMMYRMTEVSIMVYLMNIKDIMGMRPGHFFGLFSLADGSVKDAADIIKAVYLVLLLFCTLVMFAFIRKGRCRSEKLMIALGGTALLIAILNTKKFPAASLALFAAVILLGTAYYLCFFTRLKAAASFIAAAAVFLDSRCILIMTAVSLILLYLRSSKKDGKKAVFHVMMVIAAAAGLIVSMMICPKVPAFSSAQEAVSVLSETVIPDDSLFELDKDIEEGIFNTGCCGMTPVKLLLSQLCAAVIPVSHIITASEMLKMNNLVILILTVLAVSVILQHRSDRRFTAICLSLASALILFMPEKDQLVAVFSVFLLVIYQRRFQEASLVFSEKLFLPLALGVTAFRHVGFVLTASASSFALTHYFLTYTDAGFIPRAFIGTVFRILMGDVIRRSSLMAVMHTFEVVCILLEAAVFLLMLRSVKKPETRRIFMILVLMYSCSPASNCLTRNGCDLKLDWFLEFLTFVCVLVIWRNKAWIWTVPAVCLVCMLIHNVFALTFYPVIFALLVFRSFLEDDGKRVRNTAVILLSLVCVAVPLFWFEFCYTPSLTYTAKDMVDDISRRNGGDFMVYNDIIKYVIYDFDNEHRAHFKEFIISSMYVNVFIAFILSLPLIAAFAAMLKKLWMQYRAAVSRLACIAIGMAVSITLLLFIAECDFGRWASNLLRSLILTMAVVTVIQPEEKLWYKDISKKRLDILLYGTLALQAVMPGFDEMLKEMRLFEQ